VNHTFLRPTLTPVTSAKTQCADWPCPESITRTCSPSAERFSDPAAGALTRAGAVPKALTVFSTEGDVARYLSGFGRTGDHRSVTVTEKWQIAGSSNYGGIWQATPTWAFKAGYAWMSRGRTIRNRPAFHSSDRHWLTLGTQSERRAKRLHGGIAAVGIFVVSQRSKRLTSSFITICLPQSEDPAARDSTTKAEYELGR